VEPTQLLGGRGVPSAVLREGVLAATAAPSVHNTQPWLFQVRDDGVDVYVDRRRQLASLDPDGREMYVSVGAAVFNLRVALRARGWRTGATFMPRAGTDLAAEVNVRGQVEITPAARALADAIQRRHTNRRPFSDVPVPDEIMADLTRAATAEGADLVVTEGALRDGVLSLTRTADKRLRRDVGYQIELGRWTNPGGMGRRDGVPRQAFGPRAKDGALPLRDLALGIGAPAASVEFESEPTIVLLLSVGDEPADWLRVGAALERVWLTATVRGLAATPLTQVTEVPPLRALLADSATDRVVQSVLRIGYPTVNAAATPRRGLDEVIVADAHRKSIRVARP
jgi:nitroreductase